MYVGEVKVADFGFAINLTSEQSKRYNILTHTYTYIHFKYTCTYINLHILNILIYIRTYIGHQ